MLTTIQYVTTVFLQDLIVIWYLKAIVLVKVKYLRWHVVDGVVLVGEGHVLLVLVVGLVGFLGLVLWRLYLKGLLDISGVQYVVDCLLWLLLHLIDDLLSRLLGLLL